MHPAGYSQTCACAQLTWLRRKTARRSADWKFHPYVCTRLLLTRPDTTTSGTFLVWQVSLQQCPVALREKSRASSACQKLGICQTCCDRICLATHCNQSDWQMDTNGQILSCCLLRQHWNIGGQRLPRLRVAQGSAAVPNSQRCKTYRSILAGNPGIVFKFSLRVIRFWLFLLFRLHGFRDFSHGFCLLLLLCLFWPPPPRPKHPYVFMGFTITLGAQHHQKRHVSHWFHDSSTSTTVPEHHAWCAFPCNRRPN